MDSKKIIRFNEIQIPYSEALDLSQFKDMDYYAVENYALPIELMMENAGLQLARLVVNSVDNISESIVIGIGNGNNGGGGLVAARRLAAWGYTVYLDLSTEITKDLPKLQLERALKFGAKIGVAQKLNVWIDAYLGFSQRLPLPNNLVERITKTNNSDCIRISLDIPTGFLGDVVLPYFQAHKVLSLAASKKLLYNLPDTSEIYLADLGIPNEVYKEFGILAPPFYLGSILKVIR